MGGRTEDEEPSDDGERVGDAEEAPVDEEVERGEAGDGRGGVRCAYKADDVSGRVICNVESSHGVQRQSQTTRPSRESPAPAASASARH